MTDIAQVVATLRRPRILIRAARHGLNEYSRDRTLPKLIESPQTKSPETTLAALVEAEAVQEAVRKSGDASYSVTRHLELLIAMMAEARLLLSSRRARAGA